MSPAAHAVTLTARRSARLVTWARAWRAGLVSFDEIVDDLTAEEEQHVRDLPGTWREEVELREALPVLAKLHPDEIRLVLPAPGDPRGLPGPGPFTSHALLAGEGVIASRLGLVPEARQHVSGSGVSFTTVVWRAFELPEAPAGYQIGVREADGALSIALADTTTRLVRLDVAQWRPELAGALAALRKPDSETDLPPGYDPRARRLYARACVVDRVLSLAGQAAPGGALNSFEAQQRDEALRPLAVACRNALVAACNSPFGG
ncbi:hypothetical protein Cs7R123_21050 [Catellatospora sp. TT07R-123]|uniref:hypothetical protein n=1 Tax=Catellatospora sp. TT07R-123 TaxID=2733863 RepID=UPI001B1FD6ED|nr:hypothetical protein [Catellatospora sp. TT07R-123]GHJ44763.1 hypothetical protein Cs7R123_21050 [Catellatospora sp. TT07R-123]